MVHQSRGRLGAAQARRSRYSGGAIDHGGGSQLGEVVAEAVIGSGTSIGQFLADHPKRRDRPAYTVQRGLAVLCCGVEVAGTGWSTAPSQRACGSRPPSPTDRAGVPIADRVLPLIRACADGRGPDERLFVTESGHRLHATALKRTLAWSTVAEGRRIHDLRHTAACLWLARGVDVVTVQAWMGHASVATTNLYLHHLGTSADKAGLERLNRPGHTGGTNQTDESQSHDGES